MKKIPVVILCCVFIMACIGTATAVTGGDWSPGTLHAAFTSRQGHTSVVFNDRMWIVGGTDGATIRNDTWSSADGITWTLVNASPMFSARNSAASVVFSNKMWIIGGNNGLSDLNDTWSSGDGNIWTRVNSSAEFPARSFHSAVIFNNTIWVIGGYSNGIFNNDTWYSIDGNIWTRANASAGFPAREQQSSLVFGNQMWTIGGFNGEYLNDIWKSGDGSVWTRVNGSAAFSGRSNHAIVVFNGALWLTGGQKMAGTTNDTWSSADGNIWILANTSAAFPARNAHTSVVLGNRIWVLGGADSTGYFNDTWYTDGPPAPVPPAPVPASDSEGIAGQSLVQSSIRKVPATGGPVTFNFGQKLSATNPVRIESVTIVPSGTREGQVLCVVRDESLKGHPVPAGQDIAGLTEIDVNWIREGSTAGTIAFSLDREWIEGHHTSPQNIVLLRNSGGEWQELPTTLSRENGGRCYYTAETPGFSTFAVATKVMEQVTSQPTVSLTVTQTNTIVRTENHVTNSPTSSQLPAEAVTTSTRSLPISTDSQSNESFALPVLILASGIVVCAAVLILRRWWIQRQNPALFRKYR